MVPPDVFPEALKHIGKSLLKVTRRVEHRDGISKSSEGMIQLLALWGITCTSPLTRRKTLGRRK